MNLRLPEIAVFAILLAFALYRGRSSLFALWPVAILVFPTARISLGFPIYLYDIVAAAILFLYRGELLALRWGADRMPWHYVFFALIVICGLAWPLFVLPPSAQMVWVAAHAVLAFAGIAIFALIFSEGGYARERVLLGYGVAASVLVLGVIGLLQFGSPDTAGQVAGIFYRDFGEDAFVNSRSYAQMAAQRAAGPYGSANILGVVAVLGALAASLLVRERMLLTATLVAALIAILSSVSRQAMIGVVLAGVVYFLMSRRRERIGAGMFVAVAAPLIVVGFLASDYSASVFERFGRWSEGVQEDDNFTARYIDGPARLANAVQEFPSILLFGTGPDIGKLVSAGIRTGGREAGFVSVGYLLFLFQYGVLGLAAAIAMLVQAWRHLRFVPSAQKARAAALLTAICTFYLTDNAPNISESVTMLCFLGVGAGAGCAIRALSRRRGAPPEASGWRGLPAGLVRS